MSILVDSHHAFLPHVVSPLPVGSLSLTPTVDWLNPLPPDTVSDPSATLQSIKL